MISLNVVVLIAWQAGEIIEMEMKRLQISKKKKGNLFLIAFSDEPEFHKSVGALKK